MGEESEADGNPTESTEATAGDELSPTDAEPSEDELTEDELVDDSDDGAESGELTGNEGPTEGAESTVADAETTVEESKADAQSDGGISPVEPAETDEAETDEDEIVQEAAAAIEGESRTEAETMPESGTEPAAEAATEAESPPVTDDHDVGDPADATEPDVVDSEYDPIQDEEMPLAEHIEEMIKRLAVVVVVAGAVSLVIFPFAEHIINFLWDSAIIGNDSTRPRVYGPLALKLTELKVASLGGLIVALPVVVYETYRFMRPGLYPHERRYYLAAVPTSLVLAFIGVSFAYFLVLPAIFTYFLYYSDDVAIIAFGLSKTFDLILLLMGYLALVFQIPLFIMLAIMMGLTTRQWLESRRLYFWGGFLGVSFLFSPDPTGMAPIMVAATMVTLFEGTLVLLRWTGR